MPRPNQAAAAVGRREGRRQITLSVADSSQLTVSLNSLKACGYLSQAMSYLGRDSRFLHLYALQIFKEGKPCELKLDPSWIEELQPVVHMSGHQFCTCRSTRDTVRGLNKIRLLSPTRWQRVLHALRVKKGVLNSLFVFPIRDYTNQVRGLDGQPWLPCRHIVSTSTGAQMIPS